jgi:hypothetical protein
VRVACWFMCAAAALAAAIPAGAQCWRQLGPDQIGNTPIAALAIDQELPGASAASELIVAHT